MTPEQLKAYLDEDIKYETELIEQVNNEQKEFFNKLIEKLSSRIK